MTVPEMLFERALQAGFTVEAACAVLANVQGESAFRADNAEDRIHTSGVSDEEYIRRADAGEMTYNGKNFIYDAVGFGYAQWTYWSRKKGLFEFCKNRGVSVSDPDAQKEFLFFEMERDFAGIWDMCRTSHDLNTLMHQLIWVWENPADKQGAMFVRMPFAQAWLAKFTNWENPSESSEPVPVNENEDTVEKSWPPRMINEGLNWNETFLLQSLLLCHGYSVVVNGIFDANTKKKLEAYQLANGLSADGVAGPKTWRSLVAGC